MESISGEIKSAVAGIITLAILGVIAKCRTYLLIKVSPVFRLFGNVPARANVTLHAGINENPASLLGATEADARTAMQLENLYEELASLFGAWAYQWPFAVTEYSVTDTETVADYGQSIAEQCGISTYDQFVEAIR